MGKVGSDLNPTGITTLLPLSDEVRLGDIQETTTVVETTDDQPIQTTGTTMPVEVPDTLIQNPAELLALSKAQFEGVNEAVLTGKRVHQNWPDLGMGDREKLEKTLAPGITGVVLGPVVGTDPPTVTLMPTKGVTGPDVTAKIQAKILEGERLYQQIMSGNQPPVTKQNAALLMWYLQALCSSKASMSSGSPDGPTLYREGALTIEDPEHRLENFLQSFNTYRRSSSHLDEYQRIPGCETHGLDLRGVEMPNDRRTVMFARLPSTREAPNGPNLGDKSLLFLKMEEHGCRGFSFQGTGEKTGVWQGIKRFFSNIGDFFGHAGGWLTSIRQRQGGVAVTGQNNRERVDKAICQPYDSALKVVQDRIDALTDPKLPIGDRHPQAVQLLTVISNIMDDPGRNAKIGGVHFMLDKLGLAETALDKMQEALDRTTVGEHLTLDDPHLENVFVTQELKSLFADMKLGERLTAARTLLESRGDHPELRFGREVILMQDEMDIGECSGVGRLSEGKLTGSGTLPTRSQELTLAGYHYIALDLENQSETYLEQFNKDVPRGTYTVSGLDYEYTPVETDGSSDVGQAIDQLVSGSGDPPELATLIKCLAHQGLFAVMAGKVVEDAIFTTGLPLTMSSVDAVMHYDLGRIPSDEGDVNVYRLSCSFDTRDTRPDSEIKGLLPVLGGPAVLIDLGQSYLKVDQALLISLNRETGELKIGFDGDPSFKYELTPPQNQPTAPEGV